MKKLSLLAVALMGALSYSNAQVAYSEDFESTTGTALPTGWSQVNAGGTAANVGWYSGTDATLASSPDFPIPTHTRFVGLNDDKVQATDNSNSFLESATFSLAGLTGTPYVSFDQCFLGNTYSGATETMSLEVSTDGGTTWTVLQALAGNSQYYWETKHISMAAYAGMSNIKLGWRYKDGGGWLYGAALDNISVGVPPANELALVAMNPYPGSTNYAQANGTVPVQVQVMNNGTTTVTAFNVSYQLGTAAVVTTPITGVSIAAFSSTTVNATALALPATLGDQTLTAWVTLPGDTVLSNDSAMATVTVVDSIINKMVLFEEFNQASCDPCAEATPNIDSVTTTNLYRLNGVRYHVNFPGRDCMDSVTLGEFVQDQLTFYAVQGVPDAQLDGNDTYPGAGSYTTDLVSSYAAPGTPVKITVDATNYDPATNMYTATATIKAFANLPAGLIAKAALTVDTIKYRMNQSTESIAQTVFPQVAEHMFPDANGTTMAAFTAGQSQTINLSWVKNHPWGSDYAGDGNGNNAWPYDSTAFGHITVWLQDNSTKQVYQSASKSVGAGGGGLTTGISSVDAIVNNVTVFPNPASTNATLHISLKDATELNVSVTDMAGREVYNNAIGHVAVGDMNLNIPTAALANGMYNVLVKTTGGTVTKRLSVVK